MKSLIITCPSCGVTNDFVIEGNLVDWDEVRCSKCPQPLGTWGDLQSLALARKGDDAAEPHLANVD